MRKAGMIGILAAVAASAGCGSESRAEDNGATVHQSYEVGAFERIEVAGPYDVRVRTGENASVVASGPAKVMERLVVEVKGDRLLIHTRSDRNMFNWARGSRGTATIEVTAPALRAATIAGSGTVAVDQVSGDSFAGAIAGSGDLNVDSLDVRTMKLSISGSGDLRVGSGQAQSAEYRVAGSGNIDGRGVRSETAKVSISGSGSVHSQATGTADIGISGSGDVVLTGGAKCQVRKSGSGNVRCS
ncbi:MAG TPA: head GIN domain-containing protein [Sphingomicrobium sp.]|nr:head GIN domain-containing protein [Sphingomicrobium sp.]